MPDDIEYVGLMAEAWDALRGDTSAWKDRAWFREVIRQRGEPVLDVGTGTGRLLLDFLAEGVDIEGVDNAPDMLERLHTKAAAAGLDVDGRVHLGRMQSIRLSRRYRTIMVPSSSFQLLLEPDDGADAMRRFFGLLLPGGSLAMPFIVMDKPYQEHWTREATLEDGSLIRRTSTASFDPAAGIEGTDDLYEVFEDGELVRTEHFVRPRATRAYTRDEARAAYETAGFRDLEWGADFTFNDSPNAEISTVEKLGWVREAAGDRFDDLEFNVYPTGVPPIVTDHARKTAADVLDQLGPPPGTEISVDELLESPHMFIGSVNGLVTKLQEQRERLGISSIMVGDLDTLAPVVERLAGT